ncbi:MAG: hypothetical protein PHN43_00450, partial [Patescibacteria group bacterium]|nr:hypothetical protein [Patescibacteria group bacterium]MDD3435492.1 hypothetical protein [Patescibacteria group bacterium]
MKKNYILIIITGVLLLVLLIFGLGYCNRSTQQEEQFSQLKEEKEQAQSQAEIEALRADSLQEALNECLGIEAPLSPEDSMKLEIENLKKDLASLRRRSAPAKKDVVVATFDEKFKRSEPVIEQRSVEKFAGTDTRLPIT